MLRIAHGQKIQNYKLMNIQFPTHIDWRTWIKRWDRMQDLYIPDRIERFDAIVQLMSATQRKVSRVLDVGCGTGSVMLHILKAFPDASVWGIDFDPTLLALAQKRLTKFGGRVKLVEADLRKRHWTELFRSPFNAIVSATALHWFSQQQLSRLYKEFARILKPGGIFLNADHAGSPCKQIQKTWQTQRHIHTQNYEKKGIDDWNGFWLAYGKALKTDVRNFRKKLTGRWVGSEQGLPLEWHFDKLKTSGFEAIDCFWRRDYDAVYGGIKK
jgi:ubiquinone/menaquinone biosynthesis C-methylase UbiE